MLSKCHIILEALFPYERSSNFPINIAYEDLFYSTQAF